MATALNSTGLLAELSAEARYEALDAELTVEDVPDFRTRHTHTGPKGERTFVDAEDCVAAMREWLDDRINAGEPRRASRNSDHQSINTRANIRHWTYRDAPRLPSPKTMDGDGASCVEVSLKGTVEEGTRHDDPEPKTEAYQSLWNVVCTFAHATGAEVRLAYSQLPRDDLSAYLFYDL